MEREQSGGILQVNPHAPPIENVLIRAKAEEEMRQKKKKEKENKAKEKAQKEKAKDKEAEKGGKAAAVAAK